MFDNCAQREAPGYRGRFAPSPTGPLHFGSLVAAVGSFLEARVRGGRWLVRIEDIDPPREVAGAADDILRTLEAFALTWDDEVVYQSRRLDAYRAVLEQLRDQGRVYPCGCSRADVAASGQAIYPGTCRNGIPAGRRPRSYRVRVDAGAVEVCDRVQGRTRQDLEREVGDFVLWRADGFPAYQLAVVVDDAWQQVTDVVRGCDLLESTPRQTLLQSLLGYSRPSYAHLPLAVTAEGDKLSKQTGAPAVCVDSAAETLLGALEFLGQSPPLELSRAAPATILDWALEHWRLERVPAAAVVGARADA